MIIEYERLDGITGLPPSDPKSYVGAELRRCLETRIGEGAASSRLEGQLIRPLVAYAGAAGMVGGASPTERFWSSALAVQLAHEASMIHDDIIDRAEMRRSEPTLAARDGLASALVAGDQLLTTAYRFAAESDSIEFVKLFARSVERTVEGEILQGRGVGRVLDLNEYREINLCKSGELLGISLAAAATLEGSPDAERLFELGRRLGLVYQMVDDLLDYCPSAGTGKPPLADHRQRKWTWVLLELGADVFDRESASVAADLHHLEAGSSPIRRSLAALEGEVEWIRGEIEPLLPHQTVIPSLLDDWIARARSAVAIEESRNLHLSSSLRLPRASKRLRSLVPLPSELTAYLARNSRSFRFASRLLPAGERARIERVYAFCRVTDDIVDRTDSRTVAERAELLAEWAAVARTSHGGVASGIPLLDEVMADAARHGIPFTYPAMLCEGMEMDLAGTRYRSLSELRGYTYRVASVVGLWITELAGIRDTEVLERAAGMGHAMQLTNILRDVGEDLREGRLYLPSDRMAVHDISEERLRCMLQGSEPIGNDYRALIDSMMEEAEIEYSLALKALERIPLAYRGAFGVAAYVYRGIHEAIRSNGHDNLTRRAHTTTLRKLSLASRALWRTGSGAAVARVLGPHAAMPVAPGRDRA
jgi:phytoene synthase